MWMYLVVFLATLAVDTIPIFAPPAWIILVFLVVTFHLNPWIAVIIGVAGSTLGRYILSLYIPKVSSKLINRREDENLRYIGGKLGQRAWAAAGFVFLYTLTPLSTTALFTAAGMARVDCRYILTAFFCGRLITDGALVYSGKYAATNLPELIRGQFSWQTVVILVAGLAVIALVLFIDWRQLLAKHRLKLRFNILARRRGKR
jgi:membrane protein YqaA with SNARE-associated domain